MLLTKLLSNSKPVCFRNTRILFPSSRFYSSEDKDSEKPEKKELEFKKTNNIQSFKVKQTTSSAAPSPIDPNNGILKLLKKDNKPYVPKLRHERLTYDYPGLPNEDEFAQAKKAANISRWSRYVPKILTAIVLAWGAYTVSVWFFDEETGSQSKDILSTEEFHKYVITHKEEVDEDHYLIEITPKFKFWQYAYQQDYPNKSIWNGDRIWSVDVKQPDIMVVRSYTPLPMYFLKSEYTRSGERKPLLKVINNDGEDCDKQGVMCLYIKKYKDGEVSRYVVNKNIGDEIELRGPNIEYKFPYHPLKQYFERPIFRDLPSKVEADNFSQRIIKQNKLPEFDNLNFYAAGTGIAPILQVLLSRNPYRGFVNIHYSAKKPGELKNLERFIFFLEKLDRVKMFYHYDTNPKSMLSPKDITKPIPSNYLSPQRLESIEGQSTTDPADMLKLRMEILNSDNSQDKSDLEEYKGPRYETAIEQALATSKIPKMPASLSIVCGPDGYVSYVAGDKDMVHHKQGDVKGLLGDKSWNNNNVYKL